MKTNKRRGISLIVLVITIIVMIILAAAIILSLNSAGIIGKANQAKTDTNDKQLLEAASLHLAEYDLAVKTGDASVAGKDAQTYVREKLDGDNFSQADINRVTVVDGEIVIANSGSTAKSLAERIQELNVPIGAEVSGYVLSADDSAKIVNTDGLENTYSGAEYSLEGETDPQPATGIARDQNITWKYFGIDENGNALIVGSVTSATPVITLGGKGGYLNGPSTLKTICETMYSSNMGNARSITMKDVIRVLEYTGPKGSYEDNVTFEYTPMAEPKTIKEIAAQIGCSMNVLATTTPEAGREIGDYLSDYYAIRKTVDESHYNREMKNLIYPGTTTTNPTLTTEYWVSDSCVYAKFDLNYVAYSVRCVSDISVSGVDMFISMGFSYSYSYAVRPVVELNESVQVSYVDGVLTLN